MNELEIDAMAEGLFKYLVEKTEHPLDGIAVIGVTLLKVFDASTDSTITIDKFAEDFKKSLLESYKTRTAIGPETVQ